jgi:hypothetical protein
MQEKGQPSRKGKIGFLYAFRSSVVKAFYRMYRLKS